MLWIINVDIVVFLVSDVFFNNQVEDIPAAALVIPWERAVYLNLAWG